MLLTANFFSLVFVHYCSDYARIESIFYGRQHHSFGLRASAQGFHQENGCCRCGGGGDAAVQDAGLWQNQAPSSAA